MNKTLDAACTQATHKREALKPLPLVEARAWQLGHLYQTCFSALELHCLLRFLRNFLDQPLSAN